MLSEVEDAIRQLKNGKSCGIDGIPSEYYKHTIYILAPYLKIFNSIFDCELWNSIFNTDMQQLEVSHHFPSLLFETCPRSTHLMRSDMDLHLARLTSIEAQIQKIAFLDPLCQAPTDESCHKLNILRLCQFDLCEKTASFQIFRRFTLKTI
ncbi:hypothetical protein DPMN_167370 [Dreissena polymorpha]|uniref:Uncharacterized protein n=1 Tax=Dreissena polymorpha TaxID=45954 RepID=A0A9D4F4D4_DREPO|nr:hypothetical protein DPMN_167370 [Dreissena polymorpha]